MANTLLWYLRSSALVPHTSHRSCTLLPCTVAKIIQNGFCYKNNCRQRILCTQNPTYAHLEQTMKTVKLSSGQEMPLVGLGTWQAKPGEVEAAIEAALGVGYRHIDTAFNYNNEDSIGNVLKEWLGSEKISRNELFVTTKLPHIGNRPADVAKYLDISLKRLKLEYLDLYLIHLPFGFLPDQNGDAPAVGEDGNYVLDTSTDHIAVWKAMEEQVNAGKVRSIGVSNFNISQLNRIVKNAQILPSVLQIELHAGLQQTELCKFCKDNGIVVTAYSPLGSPGAKQHFQMKYNYSPTVFPNLMETPLVQQLADKYGKKPAQILLRHLVQQGIVVIPKSSNSQRIKENIEIFDFELQEEEIRKLNEMDKGDEGRIFNFLFWKGVEKHPEYPFPHILK